MLHVVKSLGSLDEMAHGETADPKSRRSDTLKWAMKNSGTAFLLAALGLVTPVAGIHRFYLGRRITGVLYLVTWGFFGIGTVLDLLTLERMVDDENRRLLYPGSPPQTRALTGQTSALAMAVPQAAAEHLSPEQQVLRVAKQHNGAVTVEVVAVETGLSLHRAKKELERLRKQEYCTLDISSEGAKLYVFDGLRSDRPLELS